MKSKEQSKKNKNVVSALITGVLLLVFAVDSALISAKQKVPSGSAEFLSKVRYIISKDEKKFFKNLPVAKREEFIEQFWEARDPSADTPENEFKEEYFRRIDEANRKFTVGLEGWLTDRGKTYILLGPPRHVSDYPIGDIYNRRPYVVWHYDEIFLVFVDEFGDGDLRVLYVPMPSIMAHQALVQEAFLEARQNLSYMEDLFNYSFGYKKIKNAPHLRFAFDLAKMNFKRDGDKMVSQLEIAVTARDRAYNKAWTYRKTHDVTFNSGEDIPKKIIVHVPIDKKLNKGKYFFYTSVKKMDEKNRVFNNRLIKVK
jgi:GWxTD domain-containing protein